MILLHAFCHIMGWTFLQHLNSLHSFPQFMTEVENNMLPFQDTLVEKTATYFLTSLFAPKSWKINFVGTLTHHAVICSECKLDAKLRHITNILLTNCYPESVIKSNIRLKIFKFKETQTFGPPKCPVYMRLPWTGPHSQLCTDKIFSSIIHCFSCVLKQFLMVT